MPLPTTEYFEQVLRAPYEALCRSPQATAYLTGVFRYDGTPLDAADTFQLEDVTMTSREAAQLLMVFDGSRVSEQAQHDIGRDEAPPGTYFTIVNPALIHEGHKNRIGVYEEEGDGQSLHLDDGVADALLTGVDEASDLPDKREPAGNAEEPVPNQPARAVHVDHFFLRRQAPDRLGTVAFALCAIVAHRMGYTHISLVAGGGHGHDPHMIGSETGL